MLDTIGARAAQAIKDKAYELGISQEDELDYLGLTRTCLFYWQSGRNDPRAKQLREMALSGYDVIYILTGEKHDGQSCE